MRSWNSHDSRPLLEDFSSNDSYKYADSDSLTVILPASSLVEASGS
jgi:hypothetical protein